MKTKAPLVALTPAQRALVEAAEEKVQAIVGSAARRFPSPPRSDMLQAGRMACAEAATTYRTELGVPFHGYFAKRVYGAAVQAAIEIVYGGRHGAWMRRVAGENDELPSDAAPSDFFAEPRDPKEEMLERARELAGLLLSASTREAAANPALDEQKRANEARVGLLREALASLPQRERRVMEGLWFEDKNSDAVGQEENLSGRSIRRFETAAYIKIAKYVNARSSKDA